MSDNRTIVSSAVSDIIPTNEGQATIGRPTDYCPEIVDRICAYLEQGMTIHAACTEVGIAPATYFNWARSSREFLERSARARELGADAICDEAQQRLDAATAQTISVVREQAHHLRWRASKLAPRRYGDRLAAEVTGAQGGPIEAVAGARARLLAKLGIKDDDMT
jgi:transposase-like protein